MATRIPFPPFKLSTAASLSWSLSIRSASFNNSAPLSFPGFFKPQVVLKALRAALTAVSTSSLVACATSTRCLPVAGLIVSNVSFDEEATHSLLLHGLSYRPSPPDDVPCDSHEKTDREVELAGTGYIDLSVGCHGAYRMAERCEEVGLSSQVGNSAIAHHETELYLMSDLPGMSPCSVIGRLGWPIIRILPPELLFQPKLNQRIRQLFFLDPHPVPPADTVSQDSLESSRGR